MLESLHDTLTRLGLQKTIMGLLDNFSHFSLVHEDFVSHCLDNLWLGDDILHTYCEASVNQPVIDDKLDV